MSRHAVGGLWRVRHSRAEGCAFSTGQTCSFQTPAACSNRFSPALIAKETVETMEPGPTTRQRIPSLCPDFEQSNVCFLLPRDFRFRSKKLPSRDAGVGNLSTRSPLDPCHQTPRANSAVRPPEKALDSRCSWMVGEDLRVLMPFTLEDSK